VNESNIVNNLVDIQDGRARTDRAHGDLIDRATARATPAAAPLANEAACHVGFAKTNQSGLRPSRRLFLQGSLAAGFAAASVAPLTHKRALARYKGGQVLNGSAIDRSQPRQRRRH